MNILEKCIKSDSYSIIKILSPLIDNFKIDNLNKFKKIFNLIKNNYKIREKEIEQINKNDDSFNNIINTVNNWRDIKQLQEGLKAVERVLIYKTKYLELNYIIPSNMDIDYGLTQFGKIINIALTLETIIPNKVGSVYIYPVHYKRDLYVKQFESKKGEIKHLERNYMAFTISGQVYKDRKSVFVVRDEECIKLFIHELLHLLEADMIGNTFVGDKIYDIVENFNIKLVGGSFESYTELLSNILNIIFFILNNKLDENLLEELIKIEIIYGIYSTGKLLYLYGYDKTNYQDFFKNKNDKLEIVNNIPSTYYYIVKSMYYYYFNDWIDLLDNKLSLSKQFINKEIEIIKKSIQNNSEYMKLLEKCLELRDESNDLTMRYSLIDDNCGNVMKGGSNIKYKKYIINLYKYVN
jgi:hypothetical protein